MPSGGPRKSKRKHSEISGGGQDAVAPPVAKQPKKDTTRTVTPTLPKLTDDDRFFRAREYVITNEAHNRLGRLVREDGPYRRKALELTGLSIEEENNRLKKLGEDPLQMSADELILLALDGLNYYWAKPTDCHIKYDNATASMSMGIERDSGDYFPCIGINECFRRNDCLIGQAAADILQTSDGKKTLLLFFRKFKREFLHLLQRYLQIVYRHTFTEDLTPKKYTPRIQANGANPSPEVGDHDEEEDSGGPILPLRNYQKLWKHNPLCVYFKGNYLPLNDAQVAQLTELDLYKVEVDENISSNFWTPASTRAFIANKLTADFFDQEPPAKPKTKNTKSFRASKSSSPTGKRTPKANTPRRPLWRTLKEPIVFPAGFLRSRNVVSRSNSAKRSS